MLRRLYILILLVTVTSCDIAKEDAVAPDIGDENPANIFYTLQENNLTIDPTAFAELKEATSLSISQLPKNGEAKFIENGFIFYRLTNKAATSDAFSVEGKTATGGSITEEVKINFVSNPSDLPCYAGALGDNARTEPEKGVEVNVMLNDKTCSSIADNSLVIEIPPKNGKAEVMNQRIVYTPNKDYVGDDIFFYRVGINTKKNPVASVDLKIAESAECTSSIIDDIINILSYTPNSELPLDVLQNDRLCVLYKDAELKILTNPTVGTLRIDKTVGTRPVIMYKLTEPYKGQQSFEYALYRSEKLFIKAKVTVNFN
ncbi:Ig-like domain-containing protein [Emticicia agri]|uniref:Lipoprotein n=1 Tax=Emticicia agri TaxID=2492393 RepID=A0A4Q5LWK6_9BACT|nr:Ig-like domain-containing protein [Emticicia agri]RYU93965.1 hypothetical protein EWM59_19590 [Emticicia agri]